MTLITGYFSVSLLLGADEKPSLAEPLLKDNMKRLVGDIIVKSKYRDLLIDMHPVVFDQETLTISQQVFIAKTRPDECDLNEFLHVSGFPAPYRIYKGKVFDHAPKIGKQIYRRIG